MAEEFVDPIAQRLIEAQSRFDHKSAETRFNKGIRTRAVWKGNHHNCKHETGVCDANNAWLVNAPKLENGEFPFVRIVIEMNMERRAQGGQVVEYPAHLDMDDELLYKAKGMLSDRDVKDAEKLRPSQRVEADLRHKHIEGVDREMRHNKASWADIQKARGDLNAKFELAIAAFGKSEKPAKGKGDASKSKGDA